MWRSATSSSRFQHLDHDKLSQFTLRCLRFRNALDLEKQWRYEAYLVHKAKYDTMVELMGLQDESNFTQSAALDGNNSPSDAGGMGGTGGGGSSAQDELYKIKELETRLDTLNEKEKAINEQLARCAS